MNTTALRSSSTASLAISSKSSSSPTILSWNSPRDSRKTFWMTKRPSKSSSRSIPILLIFEFSDPKKIGQEVICEGWRAVHQGTGVLPNAWGADQGPLMANQPPFKSIWPLLCFLISFKLKMTKIISDVLYFLPDLFNLTISSKTSRWFLFLRTSFCPCSLYDFVKKTAQNHKKFKIVLIAFSASSCSLKITKPAPWDFPFATLF